MRKWFLFLVAFHIAPFGRGNKDDLLTSPLHMSGLVVWIPVLASAVSTCTHVRSCIHSVAMCLHGFYSNIPRLSIPISWHPPEKAPNLLPSSMLLSCGSWSPPSQSPHKPCLRLTSYEEFPTIAFPTQEFKDPYIGFRLNRKFPPIPSSDFWALLCHSLRSPVPEEQHFMEICEPL